MVVTPTTTIYVDGLASPGTESSEQPTKPDAFKLSTDEAVEQAAHLRSQMHILWGTLLYERSVGEFKMDLSAWEKSLAAAVKTFELAVSSPTDLAVTIKNHCSNGTASADNLDKF
ncbi:unnamed protein product [Lactuca saligna]|uniref:Uncharacterized protein n=1 Tax=Lactuca saligna TaxID=75948 RepID=A0AA35ZQZ9_LACSI|nr:unnamed protein product [Lactuca saligna]